MSALLQTEDEWAARNDALATGLVELLERHAPLGASRALDVGCDKTGAMTDLIGSLFPADWAGIDPKIAQEARSRRGYVLRHGWAHRIPYPDSQFDCVVFANVYEHVDPGQRDSTIAEIRRVLAPGGILVGQLPNPFFPVESHSRLPFIGWLPRGLRERYWQMASPVPWSYDFEVVTIRDLQRRMEAAGLVTLQIRNFSYPPAAIPRRVRAFARLLERPMKLLPWAWQFAFRKPRTQEH